MLQELQGSLNYIQQFLPHTSTTTSVSSTQTSWKIPNVVNVSASQTIGELTVNVVLDYFGTIYVSAYQRQLNYTYQIQELANCTGLLVNSFNFSCTFPVEPSTSYIVHVTVGDIGPLFSTLSTQFTTL